MDFYGDAASAAPTKRQSRRADFYVQVPRKDGTSALSNPVDPILFQVVSQLIAYLDPDQSSSGPVSSVPALYEFASQVLFEGLPQSADKFSFVVSAIDLQRILTDFFALHQNYTFFPLVNNPVDSEPPRQCHWSAFTFFSKTSGQQVSVLLTSTSPFVHMTTEHHNVAKKTMKVSRTQPPEEYTQPLPPPRQNNQPAVTWSGGAQQIDEIIPSFSVPPQQYYTPQSASSKPVPAKNIHDPMRAYSGW